MLPPVPTRRRLQRAHDFEANTRLRYPLSTLHERRCRHPCKTCFRLAGSAFAGRASNPLGHKERFQATSILLSRAYPDASWAHVRRGFFEIARKGNAPIATQALMRIAALYRIEETIRGKSTEQRRAVRREQSAPHCDALKRFLERQLGRVSAKAPIAQAIRYTLKHWQGLTRFLDDGRIDLDSNIVERSMRPQVLTRKNALFAGHDDGAQNWAIVASLIETSKLSGIDPYRYLADVLFHLVNLWPNSRLDELLPWNWAAAKDHLQRAA